MLYLPWPLAILVGLGVGVAIIVGIRLLFYIHEGRLQAATEKAFTRLGHVLMTRSVDLLKKESETASSVSINEIGSGEHKRLLDLMPRRPEDYDPWGEVKRWADPHQEYPDCSCGCRFARWLEGELAADWCVCTNAESHRCGLLTFEHQGCQQAQPEDEESEEGP